MEIRMRVAEAGTLVADFFRRPSPPGDPELAVIEAALFVEQTFGLGLSDDDISAVSLGSPEAVLLTISRKAGAD